MIKCLYSFFACSVIALAVQAVNVIDNGTINVELNGDGAIGSLQYPLGSDDHVGDCSVRIKYGGAVFETVEYPDSEQAYLPLNLFTGYGREYGSNFFVSSASFMQTGNSYVDQTVVLLPRVPQATVTFSYFVDADVLGTKSNDVGHYDGANKMVALSEGSTCIGFVADLDGAESTHQAVAYPADVNQQIATAFLDAPPANNVTDMAAAVSWNPTGGSANPFVLYTRLIAAPDVATAAGMTTIETTDANRRAKVVEQNRIVVKAARFRHNFKRADRDTLMFKLDIDLSQYGAIISNLFNTDLSVFIGEYRGILPSVVPFRDKKLNQVYKLKDGLNGNRRANLSYNLRQRRLRVVFNVNQTGLQQATYVTPASPDAGQIYLPVTIIFTGSSSVDTLKGGHTWIIVKSIPMTYSKKPNNAKGKF